MAVNYRRLVLDMADLGWRELRRHVRFRKERVLHQHIRLHTHKYTHTHTHKICNEILFVCKQWLQGGGDAKILCYVVYLTNGPYRESVIKLLLTVSNWVNLWSAFHRGVLDLIPHRSIIDLFWTKWRGAGFSPSIWFSPVSVLPLNAPYSFNPRRYVILANESVGK